MHLPARLRPLPWRRYLARALPVALGLTLAGAAFEYAVRRAQPPPSTQVVRPTRAGASPGSPRIPTGLRMLRGVPVWGDAGRECVAAHPERRGRSSSATRSPTASGSRTRSCSPTWWRPGSTPRSPRPAGA